MCIEKLKAFHMQQDLPSLHCAIIIVVLITAGMTVAGMAYAETAHTFQPFVEYSTLYQDNVLRLPDTLHSKNGTEQKKLSDVSHRLEMGVLIDIDYSRQNFTGWIKENLTRYQDLKQLDFNGVDLMANWKWNLGSHFSGNFGATYLRTLAPFTDFHELEKNLRTEQRNYLDGSWLFHPSWAFQTGVSRYQLTHDLQSQQFSDRVENRGEARLDYMGRTDSKTGIMFGYTKGSLPNWGQLQEAAGANNYAQYEIKGDVKWNLSYKTSFQFVGGKVYRKVETAPGKDFNGANARLRIAWQPTSQVNMNITAWREISAVDYLDALYAINKGISITPNWNVSEKLAIAVELKHQRREFTSARASSFTGVREDTLNDLTVGVTYRPLRNMTVQMAVFHNTKSSAVELSRYSNNGVMVSMQQKF